MDVSSTQVIKGLLWQSFFRCRSGSFDEKKWISRVTFESQTPSRLVEWLTGCGTWNQVHSGPSTRCIMELQSSALIQKRDKVHGREEKNIRSRRKIIRRAEETSHLRSPSLGSALPAINSTLANIETNESRIEKRPRFDLICHVTGFGVTAAGTTWLNSSWLWSPRSVIDVDLMKRNNRNSWSHTREWPIERACLIQWKQMRINLYRDKLTENIKKKKSKKVTASPYQLQYKTLLGPYSLRVSGDIPALRTLLLLRSLIHRTGNVKSNCILL